MKIEKIRVDFKEFYTKLQNAISKIREELYPNCKEYWDCNFDDYAIENLITVIFYIIMANVILSCGVFCRPLENIVSLFIVLQYQLFASIVQRRAFYLITITK